MINSIITYSNHLSVNAAAVIARLLAGIHMNFIGSSKMYSATITMQKCQIIRTNYEIIQRDAQQTKKNKKRGGEQNRNVYSTNT